MTLKYVNSWTDRHKMRGHIITTGRYITDISTMWSTCTNTVNEKFSFEWHYVY